MSSMPTRASRFTINVLHPLPKQRRTRLNPVGRHCGFRMTCLIFPKPNSGPNLCESSRLRTVIRAGKYSEGEAVCSIIRMLRFLNHRRYPTGLMTPNSVLSGVLKNPLSESSIKLDPSCTHSSKCVPPLRFVPVRHDSSYLPVNPDSCAHQTRV